MQGELVGTAREPLDNFCGTGSLGVKPENFASSHGSSRTSDKSTTQYNSVNSTAQQEIFESATA